MTIDSLIETLQRAKEEMGSGGTAVRLKIKVSPRKWVTTELTCASMCHTSITGTLPGVYLEGIHKKDNDE
jgi:hypothetical protein